ncbi:MAG: NUDIX domain-containing protein [Bacteroidota bacterium]
MKASYCIYFGEKSFLIVNELDKKLDVVKQNPGSLTYHKPSSETIDEAIRAMESDAVSSVVIVAENTHEALDLFSTKFAIIQAGGGLVENDKGEFLFIFRRGKWDLPKGKLDEGETISECALREVEEETGLTNITLNDHLCNTYHVYHERGKFVLKESVWYNMSCFSGQILTPQTEEDISEIKWLLPAEWPSIYENTFPSIKDVLHASGKLNLQ